VFISGIQKHLTKSGKVRKIRTYWLMKRQKIWWFSKRFARMLKHVLKGLR